MSKHLKEVGRLLSLVLRHEPGHIGITLDQEGYVSVDDLLAALDRHGKAIDRAGLEWIVAENNKQRFSFSADGTRIRANQGHSVTVDLGLTPVEPPEYLYHGTADTSVASILREGLKSQSRQHVHLSAEVGTATQIGSRHGKPMILQVAAGTLFRGGHVFYQSANGVWLTDHVPNDALSLNAHQP
ncbi:RNA 2'-phosphotransferase [Ahniella affigens]|uniref:Probable RNA 2'-phosphotransferase n=1 Tax=Ahniella affigens TaxID=2021234 RepID=A0A2P1PXP9_9GAMM|nr:RNA 2'-phosphotransferase [Ahniella affigens]AVP99610.1 RNA 2'-phosphotransferase [Ahniella affigens]